LPSPAVSATVENSASRDAALDVVLVAKDEFHQAGSKGAQRRFLRGSEFGILAAFVAFGLRR